MEAKLDTKKLTCICCPLGCSIEADMQGGSVVAVRGNGCPNGEKYAHTELTAPVRTLTSTVALVNSKSGMRLAPVRSSEPIPKDKLFDCMKEIANISVSAPVRIGDTVLQNAAGTGISIIITRDIN
ncbi:MAG TPA: DUF1667 domain-containing protein [Clostridia bacterium]|jgi:CxxC motif-containing protein|nr:DUF1667 domain-containing protein [Clostridiales bacterium]HZK45245.1 DUF1667 domain-containing protein [Clostridia bacterium]